MSSIQNATATLANLLPELRNEPLKSLRDIPRLEEKDKATRVFFETLEKCETVLGKRKTCEQNLGDFFRSKGIRNQGDLLRFYQQDPEEVAAYLLSGKNVLEIEETEVFDWLALNAHLLRAETIEELNNLEDVRNEVVVKVEGKNFVLNRLRAASISPILRVNSFLLDLPNHRCAHFSIIANWINEGFISRFSGLNELGFNQLQDLLLYMDISDEFALAVCEENCRRFRLKIRGNTLMLTPADEPQISKLHAFFRKFIRSVELLQGEGDLIKHINFINPTELTLKPTNNFNSALLRGINCSIEIVGNNFPDDMAKATQNLVNFVVKKVEDWAYLTKLTRLRKLVVVENVPTDRTILGQMRHLEELTITSAPLGDREVKMLCVNNPNLRALNLPNSKVGKEGFTALAALRHLTELSIGSTDGVESNFTIDLSKHNKRTFKHYHVELGFKKLEKLRVCGGNLTNEDIKTIGKFPSLKNLDILGCQINDTESLKAFLRSGALIEAKIPDDSQWQMARHFQMNVTTTKISFG